MAAQGKYQSQDYTKYVEEGDKDAAYKHEEGCCDPNKLASKCWEAHHALYSTLDEEGGEDTPFEYDDGYCDSKELINRLEAHHELNTMNVEDGEEYASSEFKEGCRSFEKQGYESFDEFEKKHRRFKQEIGWEQSPTSTPSGHGPETPVPQTDPNELAINRWEAHHALYTTHDEEGKKDAPFEYESGYGSPEEQEYESSDEYENEQSWEQSPPSIPSGHDLETPVPQTFLIDKARAVGLVDTIGPPLFPFRDVKLAKEVIGAVIDSILQQGTVPGQTEDRFTRLTTNHVDGKKTAFKWQVGSPGSMSQEEWTWKWRAHVRREDDRWRARWTNLTSLLHTAAFLGCWTRATQGNSASLTSECIKTMSDVCEKLSTAIETQLDSGGKHKFSIQSDLKTSFETANDMQSSTGYVCWTVTGPAGITTVNSAVE